MQETQIRFLGQEDPLEKGMAIHFDILAWKIPWTEKSGGLQRVGHDWATNAFTHFYRGVMNKADEAISYMEFMF